MSSTRHRMDISSLGTVLREHVFRNGGKAPASRENRNHSLRNGTVAFCIESGQK
jgi:hypothetical protein